MVQVPSKQSQGRTNDEIKMHYLSGACNGSFGLLQKSDLSATKAYSKLRICSLASIPSKGSIDRIYGKYKYVLIRCYNQIVTFFSLEPIKKQ